MNKTCPACLNPFQAATDDHRCPHCDLLLLNVAGGDLRRIDIVAKSNFASFKLSYDRLQTKGSWSVFLLACGITAATFVLPLWTQAGATLLIPLLLLGHMIALRWVLVGPALSLFSWRRRWFVRWIPRTSFLTAGTLGYASLPTPFANMIVAPLTWFGLTALTYAYLHWSLTREAIEAPLALWERLLLVSLMVILAASLIVLTIVGLVLGFTVDWVLSMVQFPTS